MHCVNLEKGLARQFLISPSITIDCCQMDLAVLSDIQLMQLQDIKKPLLGV